MLAAICIASGGCRPAPQPTPEAARFRVVVGIPPLGYLVERVGGTHVSVDVLIAPGRSPHTFEPTPRQMAGLARATLFFGVGMPFERRLLARIADVSRAIEIVDTSAGIKRRVMQRSGDHALGAAPELAATDPHVWLNPRLAEQLARRICEALQRIDPPNAESYRRNLRSLIADLDDLDARLRKILSPYSGKTVFVFHPAFGYFTDAYGLRQMSVEIEGKTPSGKALALLITQAVARHVRVVFVEPRRATAAAAAIAAEIGAKVATLDPLAGDYIENMDAIRAAIAAALREPED